MSVFQTSHPELSGVAFFMWPADSADGLLLIFQSRVKLAAAELNHYPLHPKKNEIVNKTPRHTNSRPDGLRFSSATGGLHYTPLHHGPLRDQEDLWNIERRSTFGLPFPFNSFDPSKDLQSLLCKCYFLFTKNNNTIHEYSCTLSTYPDSSYVQSSTQKVNKEAIFHIIISSLCYR